MVSSSSRLALATAVLAAAAAFTSSVSASSSSLDVLEGSYPIWHPSNVSSKYVLLRSPDFSFPASTTITASTLYITASQSPNVAGSGTEQSKLLCAYKLFVNGVFVSAGPGHNVPRQRQAINTLDLSSVLRPYPEPNTIAIASYFENVWKSTVVDATPGVQATLIITASDGSTSNLTMTGPSWSSWNATGYNNPDGDNGNGAWYHLPNEDLLLTVRQVGWDLPGFTPSPSAGWVNAGVMLPLPTPFYLEPAPAPATLWRRPCNITAFETSTGTCGTAAENTNLVLSCSGQGSSSVISAVTFASYGTPSGSCSSDGSNTFAVNASCNSPESTKDVEALCLGKVSCSIPVGNPFFGGVDPCHLTPKHLSVAVNCSGGGGGGGNNATLYSYIIDYGQEFMGGLNLTFTGGNIPEKSAILIHLGEELNPDGSVFSPTRADENYTSRWTLMPANQSSPQQVQAANMGVTQHEFIQFRYAEILNSPVPLTYDTALAWVVQHPFLGTGENPFEHECSHSTPNLQSYTAAGAGASSASSNAMEATTSITAPAVVAAVASSVGLPAAPGPGCGFLVSTYPPLDRVMNFTAYTAVATSMDINVDSQTRQRDLCHIDALITGLEQYSVFPTGDYFIQRRTFLNAFGNDSGIWGSWTEFKQSGALMAYTDPLFTGDLSIGNQVWSDNDMSIVSDSNPLLASVQFYAGVRYFNGSGNGLLHYPDNCGGSWACDPLVDWPTNTRDGYVITGNDDDAIRNGLGAQTIRGLSQLASWLGKSAAATRYAAMADSIADGILAHLLVNESSSSQAYFVDGVGQTHAAIHSTVYSIIAGTLDRLSNADAMALAPKLASYLRTLDTHTSSCMTGRWYVEALFRLGVYSADAADFGLDLLSRTTYPGWGFMIEIGATTTIESWQPSDKWNADFAHPWCASPAFLIPQWFLGVRPLDLGWSSFLVSPQTSNVTGVSATVPTPFGAIPVAVSSLQGNVTVAFVVPATSSAQVCLPLAGTAADQEREMMMKVFASDVLLVDGQQVSSTAQGRLLCVSQAISQVGAHVVSRITTATK